MLTNRQIFLSHIGQTSSAPMLLEIVQAEGIFLFDTDGKRYFDMVSGVSVSNIGHRHPKVVQAIKNQVDKYMHLMVYGEYIQSPQTEYAKLLTDQLPPTLDCIYYVNSGSEAVEGAMKLAKRCTGRTQIIACYKAYHGSTHGALSLMGSEHIKYAYRPLLPDVYFIEFNNLEHLQQITTRTAAVIIEPIQAEAGIILPDLNYLVKLRQRCTETGTMLVFDEIQTGFGRTGALFAFEQYGIVPDIMTIAKGMGGGMPIGAFVAAHNKMQTLAHNPQLGHITTFGGHPVSCAAALATLQVILDENLITQADHKGKLFIQNLTHNYIKSIRGKGLFLAIELESPLLLDRFMTKALTKGLIFDRFLFDNTCF